MIFFSMVISSHMFSKQPVRLSLWFCWTDEVCISNTCYSCPVYRAFPVKV